MRAAEALEKSLIVQKLQQKQYKQEEKERDDFIYILNVIKNKACWGKTYYRTFGVTSNVQKRLEDFGYRVKRKVWYFGIERVDIDWGM